MKKILPTLKKSLYVILTSVFLVITLAIPLTFAQSDFHPPSVLPADEVIEGYGDVCFGIGDAIRTGNIHLRHIPCFIKYFSQTLIGVAGSLSVIFVMIGGYRYVIGADEQKDAAKKTITYALIGLVVSLMAWILVDIVLQFATE